MIDLIASLLANIFPLITLSVWSQADVKTGQVHNLVLLFPVVLALIINPLNFVSVFVPVFVVLAGIFLAIRKKGLLGFADVIGLPFVLLFLININIFGIMAFMGVFGYLMMFVSQDRFDKKLKQKVYNRILLMPILLISYSVGFVTHLIFALIF